MSRILLGVTGGIAAYKAAELTRLLVKAGHEVVPLVTVGARRFVAEETFLALARRPPQEDVYPHLTRADLLVVAPCTAKTLPKLVPGLAVNGLTEGALGARRQRRDGGCARAARPGPGRARVDPAHVAASRHTRERGDGRRARCRAR